MALMESNMMERGTQAPLFELLGVDGDVHAIDDFDQASALVIVFTCNHCPYAVAYEDRLIAIQNEYRERGVQLVAICSNDATTHPGDGIEAMKRRATEKGFSFPYLRDESQSVAKAYDAACTPDVFVFDAERRLIANTRIDDSWKDPAGVDRHDLREILDATLAGQPMPFEPWASLGCNIKWKS
jgi:peroxiredoxin